MRGDNAARKRPIRGSLHSLASLSARAHTQRNLTEHTGSDVGVTGGLVGARGHLEGLGRLKVGRACGLVLPGIVGQRCVAGAGRAGNCTDGRGRWGMYKRIQEVPVREQGGGFGARRTSTAHSQNTEDYAACRIHCTTHSERQQPPMLPCIPSALSISQSRTISLTTLPWPGGPAAVPERHPRALGYSQNSSVPSSIEKWPSWWKLACSSEKLRMVWNILSRLHTTHASAAAISPTCSSRERILFG